MVSYGGKNVSSWYKKLSMAVEEEVKEVENVFSWYRIIFHSN